MWKSCWAFLRHPLLPALVLNGYAHFQLIGFSQADDNRSQSNICLLTPRLVRTTGKYSCSWVCYTTALLSVLLNELVSFVSTSSQWNMSGYCGSLRSGQFYDSVLRVCRLIYGFEEIGERSDAFTYLEGLPKRSEDMQTLIRYFGRSWEWKWHWLTN
jgi:hypothetical protein